MAWLILPALRPRGEVAPRKAINARATLGGGALIGAVEDIDALKGRSVDFQGSLVLDPEYGPDGTFFQLLVKDAEKAANVVVDSPSMLEFTQGEYVRVTGVVSGKFVGRTDSGQSVTTVRIKAAKVTTTTAESALAPATEVWNKTFKASKDGIEVTVRKVEFAAAETRVDVTVKNSGASGVFLQIPNSFLKRADKIYEARSDLPPEYRAMPIDVPPGGAATGVVVFPAVDASGALVFNLVVSGETGEKVFDLSLRS